MSFGHGSAPPAETALTHLPFGVGDVIAGRYRVERILGSGGMGVVVSGTHVTLGQRVAIKVMRPQAVSSPELVARFTREARATALLRSAHVARVLDVGELPGGLPFMVMEHLDGLDLSELARQNAQQRRPLVIPEVVDWVLQACEALAEAHRSGIVHRDLKPANLFLTQTADGAPLVKVLDFGISKLAGPDGEMNADGLTQTHSMMGSPHYMSPEQLVSARTVDARADVWSLGAVLYRLVTSEPPYQAGSTPELCVAILTWPYASMQRHRPDVPPGLDAVVGRCLTKDPAGRFAGVQELAAALVPFGSGGASAMAERVRRVATSTTGSTVVPQTMPLAGLAPADPGTVALGHAPGNVNTITHGASALPPPSEAAGARGGWSTQGRAFAALASLLFVLGVAGGGVYALRRSGMLASPRRAPTATATATNSAAATAAPPPALPPPETTATLPIASASASASATAEESPTQDAGAPLVSARPPPRRAPVAPVAASAASPSGALPDFGGRK